MSSMVDAMLGSSSLTSMPPRPCCLNSNGEGSRPPVVRSVRRSTECGPLALILQQRGFGVEHVDLRRPAGHEEDDVVLGLGGKIRKLRSAAIGRPARSCSSESMPARPTEPRPAESDAIHSRRESWFGTVDIMARRSPRWSPAGPGRIEPAFLCPDMSTPMSSSFGVGSRSTALRYMPRTFAGTSGSPSTRFTRWPARSCMNGLFMTNNCCSGDVVSSRRGAVIIGSGKS